MNESSKLIKLGSWYFNVVQLDDMQLYETYIKKTKYPANLWSSNFAYMWAISQSKRQTILWKIIDGLLVTFSHTNKNTLYLYCLPFGEADPDRLVDVVDTSLKYCLEWNRSDKQKTTLRMVNEDQLTFMKRASRYKELFTASTWVGIERHYDIGRLNALKGKPFENIRNRVNKFRRDYPDAVIEPYRESDYEELLELAKRWKETSGTKYTNVFDGTYYKELVRYSKELNQITIVIKRNEGIIGMISGGILPTNQSWGSVTKFDGHYPGLSETLIVEYTKILHRINPQAKLLNVGSDLGPGGLREYKLKFRPALSLKRYQIYLK